MVRWPGRNLCHFPPIFAFAPHSGFHFTLILARTLDSLVRVTRRVDDDHFVVDMGKVGRPRRLRPRRWHTACSPPPPEPKDPGSPRSSLPTADVRVVGASARRQITDESVPLRRAILPTPHPNTRPRGRVQSAPLRAHQVGACGWGEPHSSTHRTNGRVEADQHTPPMHWSPSFPCKQFQVLLTLFSESFASFPYGTCAWVIPLLTMNVITHRLRPGLTITGIRSLVRFGNLVRPLAVPVLYLQC